MYEAPLRRRQIEGARRLRDQLVAEERPPAVAVARLKQQPVVSLRQLRLVGMIGEERIFQPRRAIICPKIKPQ